MLTYIRLPRVPRAVVAKRLALSTLCGGTLAVAALAPMHSQAAVSPNAAADRPATAAQVSRQATDRQNTTRGNAVSRGASRTAPLAMSDATGDPVRDVAPAPATPAPAKAAAPAVPAAPARKAGPRKPAGPPPLPVIAGLDKYQVENAETIVAVGRKMGVDQRGQIIAVATALQESRLYNLYVAVDHDSLGLFQQRPSTGWGTPQEITTPSYAARAFYTRLLDTTADWGCLTCAAQRVQGSAFPYAYAAQEWLATSIVHTLYAHGN